MFYKFYNTTRLVPVKIFKIIQCEQVKNVRYVCLFLNLEMITLFSGVDFINLFAPYAIQFLPYAPTFEKLFSDVEVGHRAPKIYIER